MPKSYYDSELTAEQIEDALTAIDGVVNPGNNGKVLYIENGQIKAASASRWSGSTVLEPLNVTANGDYYPPSGTDGFDEVHVTVPSATLTTKNISSNGTYSASQDDADGYSSVTVAVPGGATVEPLEVTQNGTYNPPSGVNGYAPVTVNVSGGGGSDDWKSLTNYIESSGTQYIDTGYTLPADQSNVRFEVVCNFAQVGVWPSIYGARDASSKYGATLWVRNSSQDSVAFAWCGNTVDTYRGSYLRSPSSSSSFNGQLYGVKTKIESTRDSAVFSTVQRPNYFVIQNPSPNNATTQFSLYLFNFNQANAPFADGYCTMKLYRFRIYHGDTLAHEFIPWQENGVACLKDTVTSEIKYNAGTGDFVYGTDA